MNYFSIVQLATQIPFYIMGAMMLHFLVFAVIGIFKKKTYPKAEKKNRIGLIIPARNEETVISGLIDSIQKNNYPQDKLEIFVIAHNCKDRTAEIARSMGARVYEYNNPEENTMGYAFRHLFSMIERDYGTQSFDGFILFNADNILDKNYISCMNDAFEFYNRECVITSYRNSKNFGSNIISGLYGMYFTVGCRLESRGRTVAGCSTRVQGTGYLISSKIVKDGWPYVTLAEDWEFTADQILLNNNIRFCDAAVFYDEQPTSLRIMWRQRVRWSRGHLIVFYTRIKDLLRSIFGKGTKHRGSVYDIMVNVLPSTIIVLALQIIQIVLKLLTPLIDPAYTMRQILFGFAGESFWSNSGVVFEMLRASVYSFALTFLSAVIIFIIERKRIKDVSFPKKILIALLWPVFLLIQLPMDVQALFSKNLGWKPIPHSDQTNFEHVNQTDDHTENNETETADQNAEKQN